MPGDLRESKTWLTEDSGPIDSKNLLLDGAEYFRLGSDEAAIIWQEVEQAVASWKSVARKLGMDASGLADFDSAFAH